MNNEPSEIGSFRLLAPIARGGMGVVYRAVHMESGQKVALKTVRLPKGASSREGVERAGHLIEGIRREIYTLEHIRHPGVARIVSQGLYEGLPWYAMRLIEGPSLRQRIQSYWPREPAGVSEAETAVYPPPPLEGRKGAPAAPPTAPPAVMEEAAAGHLIEALTIVRQLCQILAFLHGEGVVHRDLKPENVLLLEDGQPVLVDFGIMRRFAGAGGREALEIDYSAAGTFLYMPPEQITSQEVDARADLYALGCILYEMVCGRPPFDKRHSSAVWLQHLKHKPLPPSHWVRGVPAPLEDLILRLLAKTPQERPGYADDVGRVLESLGAKASPAFADYQPRPYLYRASFAGRADLLQKLKDELLAAQRGEGRCVFLSAPSGAGKTRLAVEFARQAQKLGVKVLSSAITAPGGAGSEGASPYSAPLQGFRAVLRAIAARCQAGGEEMTERLLGERALILGEYEPALCQVPGAARYSPLPKLPAERAQERALLALVETLRVYTRLEAQLIVIDDIQWADDLTLKALSLLLSQPEIPLYALVLITCRSEEELKEEVKAVRQAPKTLVLGLERLGREEIARIVSGMTARNDPPLEFIRFLTEQSGGNPFFVAEYLKAAVGEGLLRRKDGRWDFFEREGQRDHYQSLSMPGSIQELVRRRLSGLDETARALVEAGAVWGKEWSLAQAGEVASLSETERLHAAQTLLLCQIVEELEGEKLCFVHDKIREIAYASLSKERLCALHHRSALLLEKTDPTAYALLAYHTRLAELPEKAHRYARLAGEHALKMGSYREARDHLANALALSALASKEGKDESSPLERARLLRLLSLASHTVGEVDASFTHSLEALRSLGLVPLPQSRSDWLRVLFRQGAEQLAHRLLPIGWLRAKGEEQATLQEAAEIVSDLAGIYLFQNRVFEMLTFQVLALNFSERSLARAPMAWAGAILGSFFGAFRLKKTARHYFDLSRKAAQQSGDIVAELKQAQMESSYYLNQGDLRTVRDYASPLIQRGQAAGATLETLELLFVLALADLAGGDLDAAFLRLQTIYESAHRMGHLVQETLARVAQGHALLQQGEFHKVLASLEPLDQRLAKDSDVTNRLNCLSLLAVARLSLGDRKGAAQKAEEARALLQLRSSSSFATYQLHALLPEVYLSLWSYAREHKEPEEPWAKHASASCRAATFYAFTAPIAEPFVRRHRARLCILKGKEARAKKHLVESIRLAASYGLPFEEASSHLALARLVRISPAERQKSLARARDLFSRIGCHWHLKEINALLA